MIARQHRQSLDLGQLAAPASLHAEALLQGTVTSCCTCARAATVQRQSRRALPDASTAKVCSWCHGETSPSPSFLAASRAIAAGRTAGAASPGAFWIVRHARLDHPRGMVLQRGAVRLPVLRPFLLKSSAGRFQLP